MFLATEPFSGYIEEAHKARNFERGSVSQPLSFCSQWESEASLNISDSKTKLDLIFYTLDMLSFCGLWLFFLYCCHFWAILRLYEKLCKIIIIWYSDLKMHIKYGSGNFQKPFHTWKWPQKDTLYGRIGLVGISWH